MAIPTKERLAQRLHAIGLSNLEALARTGAFSDYESQSATPKVDLVLAIERLEKVFAGAPFAEMLATLKKEVMDGKFDDTKEEADAEWFRREGKHKLK